MDEQHGQAGGLRALYVKHRVADIGCFVCAHAHGIQAAADHSRVRLRDARCLGPLHRIEEPTQQQSFQNQVAEVSGLVARHCHLVSTVPEFFKCLRDSR